MPPGTFQELSTGPNSSGSGVAALLELLRLFSRLYQNPKTRPRFNLLFALTSGGPFNYDGTKQVCTTDSVQKSKQKSALIF